MDEQFAEKVSAVDAAGCVALWEAPWPRLPVVLERRTAAQQATIALRVPPDLGALRGHFASVPIVPGVVHIAWALHFGHAELRTTTALTGMDHVKFRRIVQPGHRLVLSVTWESHRSSLSFQLGTRDELYSSGRLFLDAASA